jgi:hypothetical protein
MKLNIVPARTGLTWVKLGLKTFAGQPLAMAGLFFMYMAAASVLGLVPIVGVVAALAIVPAATLGLMAASAEASRGKFPMPSILISAFRAGQQRLRAMLTLGALYAAACLLITLVAGLIFPLPAGGKEADMETVVTSPAFQQSMMLTLLLYLPVSVMFWHAPALVHWHGITPAKSLFFSSVAIVRNLPAYLVYGFGWLAVFMIAGLLVTTLGGLLGGPEMIGTIMLPTALIMASMFFASLYFTFRDSFVDDNGATPESTGDAP